jgi:integrase
VENELIPPSTLQALEAVPGLRRGKCEVREGRKVRPVADAHVEAIKDHVSRQVWAIIDLMRITGMRAGEVLIMRTMDIDRSGKIWEYRPSYHKTEHHDKERIIQLGPKAQAIIEGFIKPKLDAFIFSPADAHAERMEEKRQARTKAYLAKHPRARGDGVQPSQRDRRKTKPKRLPGDRYDVTSLRRAITRACDLADAAAKAELAKAGRDVPEGRIVEQWHPHQLRHTAATKLRRQYGLEVARVILGHHSPAVTEIYAEADRKRALQVAAEVG